jgi:hypothetical protein
MLGEFDGGATEFAVAFGVVRIVACGRAIERIAIEVRGIVDKKNSVTPSRSVPSAMAGKRRRFREGWSDSE